MGRRLCAAALVAVAVLWGCGSGGSGGGIVRLGGLTGSISVLAHSPADTAVGVSTEARVRVDLDGVIVPDSLQYAETGLFAAGSPVPGSFVFDRGGRSVVFVPQAKLAKQTTYLFRLSPLTCDTSNRILDQDLAFVFTTIDDRPPSVTGATVTGGQTGVGRTVPIDVTFDEDILASSVSAATVHLCDEFGYVHPVTGQVSGAVLRATPVADLAGDRGYTLEIIGGPGGVSDVAGNELAASWSVSFRTATDSTPPTVDSVWPASSSNASPLISPRIVFSESIDPASVEPSAITFVDNVANVIPFTVVPSADQRTMALVPQVALTTGRSYVVSVISGPGAVTDVSGNPVSSPRTLGFVAGSDTTPPSPTATSPSAGATRVSINAQATVDFAEALDPASVSIDTVELSDGTSALPVALTLEAGGSRIRVVPAQLLAPGRRHTLTVAGGFDGVRDAAGNPLSTSLTVSFDTANDGTTPVARLAPYDGNASVPYTASITAHFDEALDPSTVNSTTVFVTDAWNNPVPGTITLSRADRVLRFDPASYWSPGVWYTFTMVGGPQGLYELSGNHLSSNQTSTFRAGTSNDATAPSVTVTLNATADVRKPGISVPPSGFVIDVSAIDPTHYSLDMSSVSVSISGGMAPGPEAIFLAAEIDGSTLRYVFPDSWALKAGTYQLDATVKDLSGNAGGAATLSFVVRDPDEPTLPFERTQVFWVRFDMDRDRNGRNDLDDDLLRLGFISPGDPAGTNAYMRQVLREGILGGAHAVLGRDASGAALGEDSAPVRLVHRAPLGLVHSQMACAGFDPEGGGGRSYGSSSTGTLGRAWFDYRNGNPGDHNVGTSPGLGVFPSEVFLFEASIHQQVYPSFTTTFARRFLNICPDMGGTPAGSHPLDATVLSPSFDYSSATAAERQRYDHVFDAADDWAVVISTILAHEIGHAVGLVARGGNPTGLHGDSSLHNDFASTGDIMSAALGYDSMIFLTHEYRDLNIAYLRQRLLMK